MPDYKVPEPILNSPFDEPAEHWNIEDRAQAVETVLQQPARH
jgi:hypothetical protein